MDKMMAVMKHVTEYAKRPVGGQLLKMLKTGPDANELDQKIPANSLLS